MLVPATIFAQSFSLSDSTFKGTIGYVLSVIEILIPILFALAFIAFFWGLGQFILNTGSKDGVKNGQNYMIWGIVALFALVSFKGIINFVSGDLQLGGDANSILKLPTK